MKKICMLIIAMALIFINYGQGIDFDKKSNWNAIKARAKAEHKYIFVDAFATWCAPCHKMSKEVFADSTVGNYLNGHFISVKVQMDKTNEDNEMIRSWYKDAEAIEKKYVIEEFPTLIFFNPEGKLVAREVGLFEAPSFLKICRDATDPVNNYASLIEQYQKGTLKGESLLKLALTARKYKEDSLALAIAKRYRKTVLDKQAPEKLLTLRIMPMFNEFSSVYQLKDKLIQYIYKHPEEADKGFSQEGVAKRIVNFMITRDLINPEIKKNGKVVENTPDWGALESKIARRYDEKTARENIILAKVSYYYSKKDWDAMISSWIDKIEIIGVDLTDIWACVEINNIVYSVIFKQSDDPYALKKAIEYMERLVKINPNLSAWLDTYSCVLYKTGQRDKALEIERKALSIAEQEKNQESVQIYKTMIEKMEADKPTWE